MDPVTLAVISIGATAAGAVVSAVGSNRQGRAQQTAYNYQAAIADRNRVIAGQNADYARWTGEVEAQRSGLKTSWEISRAKAGQGKSNLDVNFGSATQVRDSMHQIGWQDQEVIRSDAAKRAYIYEQEGENQGTQAIMYRRAGEDARRAGNLGAVSSILGGISNVSSRWMQASTMGVGRNTSSSGWTEWV